MLLLAGGIGITPLMALLRAELARGSTRPITLAYWVRTPGDACFLDALRALSAAHPSLRLHLATTRGMASILGPVPGDQSGAKG